MGRILPFPGEEDDFDEYLEFHNKFDDEDDLHYEQYGGYNGWSDEAINSAFDGDPSNTWNVD